MVFISCIFWSYCLLNNYPGQTKARWEFTFWRTIAKPFSSSNLRWDNRFGVIVGTNQVLVRMGRWKVILSTDMVLSTDDFQYFPPPLWWWGGKIPTSTVKNIVTPENKLIARIIFVQLLKTMQISQYVRRIAKMEKSLSLCFAYFPRPIPKCIGWHPPFFGGGFSETFVNKLMIRASRAFSRYMWS